MPKSNSAVTQLRLALLSNGYPPIPCQFKKSPIGWTSSTLADVETLESYDSKRKYGSTAIRCGNGLAGIDFDLRFEAPDIVAAIMAAITAKVPAIASAPVRRSNGSFLIPVRYDRPAGLLRYDNPAMAEYIIFEENGCFHSSAWIRPEDKTAAKPKKFQLEILGPRRKFNSHGPKNEAGDLYEWDRDIADIPIADLPEITVPDLSLIRTIFDQACEAAGLVRMQEPKQVEASGRYLYDLEPDMTIETVEGPYTVAELEKIAPPLGGYDYLRGCGSCFEPGRDNMEMLSIRFSKETGLLVHDFKTGETHLRSDRKPGDLIEISREVAAWLDARDAAMREAETAAQPPSDDDFLREARAIDSIARAVDPKVTLAHAIEFLTVEYAWWTDAHHGNGGAVPIYRYAAKPLTLAGLNNRMTNYTQKPVATGPRGGPKKGIHPVPGWMQSPRRVTIDGVVLRPDLRERLYREGGQTFLNSYFPPRHNWTGAHAWKAARPFFKWMVRLIPNRFERQYFLRLLATKVQKPWQRMIGVIMIAPDHGTGRDLMVTALSALFGEDYVATVPFEKISGGDSGMARFNHEMATSLIVVVNESRRRDGDDRTGAASAYEKLKSTIEPNEDRRIYSERKNQDAIQARSSSTFFLFSNHVDIAKIPDEDRRGFFVENGFPPTEKQITAFRAFTKDPDAVAALYHLLKHANLNRELIQDDGSKLKFNPYRAPLTNLRMEAVDAGRSEWETIFDEAIAWIGRISELYTLDQVVSVARHLYPEEASRPDFNRFMRKMALTQRPGCKVGAIKKFKIRFPEKSDKQPTVYVVTRSTRNHWTKVAMSGDVERIKVHLRNVHNALWPPAEDKADETDNTQEAALRQVAEGGKAVVLEFRQRRP